jgi:DNA-binding transcriptional LysR family regulator
MNPRLLKTFLSAARHRNLTRAAEDIHLAQSSVSDQIQSLEAELGTALFVRSKQGLALTQAGEVLQRYAEEILGLVEEARAAVGAFSAREGTVRIGTLETIASARLPGFLSTFQRKHPAIDVQLVVSGSGDLLRKLGNSEIDIAICLGAVGHDERWNRKVLFAEPLVLIMPPQSEHASQALALQDLASMRFLSTEAGCVYRRLFDSAFSDAGMAAPKLLTEVGSIGAIARMVAATGGYGLVPRVAVQDALGRGEIEEMLWPGPTRAEVSMIWRRKRVQPPVLRTLLTAVADDFSALRSIDDRPRHAVSSPL